MNVIASKRLITAAFVLLVALNVTLLGVLWWQNASRAFQWPTGHAHGRMRAPVSSLALSASQTIRFQELRDEYFRTVRPDMEKIAALKTELVHESLKEKPDNKIMTRLAADIGSLNAVVERKRALHFHELSLICSPVQRDSLKKFLEHITVNSHEMRMNGANRGRL